MANTSRRWLGPIPKLTRRAWEDVARELEEFLRKQFDSWADGIPPGVGGVVPEPIEADDAGNQGNELSGWATADHEHPVPVDIPSGLANTNVEGTSTALVRLDHQHKRDVRVQKDGGDVSTRNALDFIDGDLEWTITDDAPGDSAGVEGSLSPTYRTFARGGTVVGATVPGNYVVWQAPVAATVVAVKGYRVGGGSATINARKNGTLQHLSASHVISAADTWEDGGAVQNTGYAVGDKLEIQITALSAPFPTQVAVQVDFTRN